MNLAELQTTLKAFRLTRILQNYFIFACRLCVSSINEFSNSNDPTKIILLLRYRLSKELYTDEIHIYRPSLDIMQEIEKGDIYAYIIPEQITRSGRKFITFEKANMKSIPYFRVVKSLRMRIRFRNPCRNSGRRIDEFAIYQCYHSHRLSIYNGPSKTKKEKKRIFEFNKLLCRSVEFGEFYVEPLLPILFVKTLSEEEDSRMCCETQTEPQNPFITQ